MGTGGGGGAEETQPEGARAPGSPDKAAPTERRFSCPAHGGPRARTRHTRDQPLCSRRLWVRAAASSSPLRARLGPPRAFPQPARPSGRAKQRSCRRARRAASPQPRAPGPLPAASPEAARHPPAALRRQGPDQSRDLGCAAGQPRGRTHRCSTRTTGSRWGTWLSPGRCRRWS